MARFLTNLEKFKKVRLLLGRAFSTSPQTFPSQAFAFPTSRELKRFDVHAHDLAPVFQDPDYSQCCVCSI